MPKFKTEKFRFYDRNEREDSDVLEFSADVNINAEGKFYINLNRDVVEKFKAVGINAGSKSKNHSDGYFEAPTFEGLKKLIEELGSDYISKEIVSRVLKISYSFDTNCSYAIENGEVFPNGYYIKNTDADYWRNGSIKSFTNDPIDYSFHLYAKPYCELTYKYRSGKIVVKKLFHPSEKDGLGENGKWLDQLIRQKKPDERNLSEIEYTEEIAGFFRRLFESLFRLNEQIKDRFTPENIRQLASGMGNGLFLNAGAITEPDTETK
jgi:hypothetical protein